MGSYGITRLRDVFEAERRAVAALVEQLSPNHEPPSIDVLRAAARSDDAYVLVVRSGEHIVGMGTLIVMRTVLGVRARIEDMVVDEAYRDRGLGKQLLDALVEAARGAGALNVELSSRPERERANALYRSSGFVQRKTNVYRLAL